MEKSSASVERWSPVLSGSRRRRPEAPAHATTCHDRRSTARRRRRRRRTTTTTDHHRQQMCVRTFVLVIITTSMTFGVCYACWSLLEMYHKASRIGHCSCSPLMNGGMYLPRTGCASLSCVNDIHAEGDPRLEKTATTRLRRSVAQRTPSNLGASTLWPTSSERCAHGDWCSSLAPSSSDSVRGCRWLRTWSADSGGTETPDPSLVPSTCNSTKSGLVFSGFKNEGETLRGKTCVRILVGNPDAATFAPPREDLGGRRAPGEGMHT